MQIIKLFFIIITGAALLGGCGGSPAATARTETNAKDTIAAAKAWAEANAKDESGIRLCIMRRGTTMRRTRND